MSTVRSDLFPNYQEAGYKKKLSQQESTTLCLQSSIQDQISSDILKYTKAYKQQPGVPIKHFGAYNDELPGQNFVYGIPTQKSQGANNVIKAGEVEGVNKFLTELNESKYKSLKKYHMQYIRQPLGQTINRHYNVPEIVNTQNFKYGLQTKKNQYGAKQTIYSAVNMPEPNNVKQMYIKSHQDFQAGQQKDRNYNWNIDPADFRFGKVQKNFVHNEIKQIMSPEGYNLKFPETKFVSTHVNDFNAKKDDKLGKSSNLGQKQFSNDYVFGVRIEPNQWDAGKCLRGEASQYEVRPDDNLGKSNRHGFRNITKEGDENRVFGVPTIRYDIKKPERQSVADPNNYADETTAVQLLFPKQFASFGVEDKDFKMLRPKKQIEEIFTNIGFHFKGNIFDAIFQRSKAIEGTILQKVSCESFKRALCDMTTWNY